MLQWKENGKLLLRLAEPDLFNKPKHKWRVVILSLDKRLLYAQYLRGLPGFLHSAGRLTTDDLNF